MAYEITNRKRSSSILRVVGASTTTLELANLAVDATETVTEASIKKILWTTTGNIAINRGGVNVITLYNSGEMHLDELGYSIANNSTANVQVVVTTNGSVVIELAKLATYDPIIE
jgi:hypothetical protein